MRHSTLATLTVLGLTLATLSGCGTVPAAPPVTMEAATFGARSEGQAPFYGVDVSEILRRVLTEAGRDSRFTRVAIAEVHARGIEVTGQFGKTAALPSSAQHPLSVVLYAQTHDERVRLTIDFDQEGEMSILEEAAEPEQPNFAQPPVPHQIPFKRVMARALETELRDPRHVYDVVFYYDEGMPAYNLVSGYYYAVTAYRKSERAWGVLLPQRTLKLVR